LPRPGLSHIAGSLLRVLTYAAVGVVCIFFALTRTEVGRDGLRQQLEFQFSRSFEGSLRIGHLTGNLIYDLYARDVRIFGPDGELVARVDSVAARPDWSTLFGRTLSLRTLKLYRPVIDLRANETGSWNLAEALRPRRGAHPAAPDDQWGFTTVDLVIVHGTITTTLPQPSAAIEIPASVFDYRNTRLEQVNLRAGVTLLPSGIDMDLLRLEGELPDAFFALRSARGQVHISPKVIGLRALEVRTDRSTLLLSGSVSAPADVFRSGSESRIEIDLRESTIDADELSALLPGLPVRGRFVASARMAGPVDALVIEHLEVRSGGSRVQMEGTILGGLDALDFDLAFRDMALEEEDLAVLFPLVDRAALGRIVPAYGDITLMGLSRADSTGRIVRGTSQIDLRTRAGRVRGRADFDTDVFRVPAYRANLEVRQLDLSILAGDPRLESDLNGRLNLNGRGYGPKDARLRVSGSFGPSRLPVGRADSMVIAVDLNSGGLGGHVTMAQRGGTIQMDGQVDLSSAVPVFMIEARSSSFDVSPFIKTPAFFSRINARMTVAGEGNALRNLRGQMDLDLDPSWIEHNGTEGSIEAHHTRVSIADIDGGIRVAVEGDLIQFNLESASELDDLIATSAFWLQESFSQAAREMDKPRGRDPEERAAMDAANPARGLAMPASSRLTFHLKRSDVISSFFPSLERVDTDLSGELFFHSTERQLNVTGLLRADSLALPRFAADQLLLKLRADVDLPEAERERFNILLDGSSDRALIGGQRLVSPRLTVNIEEDGGQFSFVSVEDEAGDATRLSAAVDLLPDRNRLTITDLYAVAGGYEWSNTADYPIDFYSDAVVVPGITLEGRLPGSTGRQRIVARGVLSGLPEDVLHVDLSGVQMGQVSRLANWKRTIGGEASGRVGLRGSGATVEGSLNVVGLSLEGTVLGTLDVAALHRPGEAQVDLRATLTPDAIADNRLVVAGVTTLPTDLRSALDFGFDLDVKVEKASVFFFDLIFPEVIEHSRGKVAGEGRISGTLRNPTFEAALTVSDGHFEIPRFNLSYGVQGPVRVDRRGIHIREAMLQDGSGGYALIEGSILFNEYRFFSLDLSARVNDMQIMNVIQSRDLPFYGRIWASGSLALNGPLNQAMLRSANAITSPRSQIFIPLVESEGASDVGFIVFADSSGNLPDLRQLTSRDNVLAQRPEGERDFLEGLEIDLNIFAPQGTTVHLVIDPLVGDVLNAVGTGRIQLQRREGEFTTYGSLEVNSGDYLFTAGEVFFRRFLIEEGGSISWDGDPTNALLDINAAYRTRASRAGLPGYDVNRGGLIPVVVNLDITGRVSAPEVDLSLAIDRSARDMTAGHEGLEAILNRADRATEYATSVLLTNSFLLTTSLFETENAAGNRGIARSRDQLAFNSLSQLVSAQLNRYLSQALPALDVTFGLQGERSEELDMTYGVALRLLNERLVIRGFGVYGLYQSNDARRSQQGIEGEFVVELRLSPTVSVEAFYRREGDVLSENALTNTTGAGLSYQTQFLSWRRFFGRILGRADPSEPVEAREEIAATGPAR
jgi:translocation and assembly module TamB